MPDHHNAGMISNTGVVLTQSGAVVVDSGGSYAIGQLIVKELKKLTDKPIIAYPNSGERWDAENRAWQGPSQINEFLDAVNSSGAEIRGGCCRSGPDHIRGLMG